VKRPKRPTSYATLIGDEPPFVAFTFEQQLYGVTGLRLFPPVLPPALTTAEAAVAQAILSGASAQEIAAARRSSRRTVEHQIESLFRKLGVRSRSELRRALKPSR